jgi:hypothetical protein
MTTAMTDSQLRQFLLRRLPEDETARAEEAILLEDGFAERLREAEFDLLDDYAHARLGAADSEAVEQHLLVSAENRRSVQIARALGRQNATTESGAARTPIASRRRRTRTAWVATLLAACILAIAVIPRWHLAPQHSDSLPPVAGSATAHAPGLRAAAGLRIVSLLADVKRGAAPPSVMLEAGDTAVRLQAEVPETKSDALYVLIIEDATGRRLFAASALAVQTAGPYRFVETTVPASALAPGERTVVLTKAGVAAESAATFRWQVTGMVDSEAKK